MSPPSVVIAGAPEAGAALAAKLGEEGVEAQYLTAEGLPDAFMSLERRIEAEKPAAAIAAGAGEEALALAVTASKLGVPLATVRAEESAGGEDRARALDALTALDAGGVDGAAGVIASWLRKRPGPENLDSRP
jgi:hypothetical protein